jgi:hypothetical protein
MFYRISVGQKEIPKSHTMTEENFDYISTQLEASLNKSLHLLALQYGLAKSTAHVATELIKLPP